jgi:hypothetical protein
VEKPTHFSILRWNRLINETQERATEEVLHSRVAKVSLAQILGGKPNILSGVIYNVFNIIHKTVRPSNVRCRGALEL